MIARRSKEIKLFFPFTNLIEGTHNITQDIDLNMRVKIFKTKTFFPMMFIPRICVTPIDNCGAR